MIVFCYIDIKAMNQLDYVGKFISELNVKKYNKEYIQFTFKVIIYIIIEGLFSKRKDYFPREKFET